MCKYKLSYNFKNNIPIFITDFCGNCDGSIESASYTPITNRGCCWYFPKYTLIDIKNILYQHNTEFIYSLKTMANCHISQYYMEIRGFYDNEGYKKYTNNSIISNETKDFDSKLFFRLCPFCSNTGCSIDFSLRPHPCNLYLCRNMIAICGEKYKEYSKERKDYYSYCSYYNESMKAELINNNIDLINNFDICINIIKNYPIPYFEPRKLKKIWFSHDNNNMDI